MSELRAGNPTIRCRTHPQTLGRPQSATSIFSGSETHDILKVHGPIPVKDNKAGSFEGSSVAFAFPFSPPSSFQLESRLSCDTSAGPWGNPKKNPKPKPQALQFSNHLKPKPPASADTIKPPGPASNWDWHHEHQQRWHQLLSVSPVTVPGQASSASVASPFVLADVREASVADSSAVHAS